MKILIVYATRSGASRRSAEALGGQLPGASVVDLSKEVPAPGGYDMVIAGCGIRMGKPYGKAVRYLKENLDCLLERPIALFFCGAYPDTFKKAVGRSIPPELLSHAFCVKSFGGILPFTRAEGEAWMNLKAVEELAEAARRAAEEFAEAARKAAEELAESDR